MSGALIAGTSTEFVGDRPLRLSVRRCPVALVEGAWGSGRTTVARRIAGQGGAEPHHVEGHAFATSVSVARMRDGQWPDGLADVPALIFDDLAMLAERGGAVVGQLVALLEQRAARGLRTVCVAAPDDGSLSALCERLAPGPVVHVLLRFPARSGRIRFARREAAARGLPPEAASGLEHLEPWTYEAVRRALDAAP
ncbi:MAG: hypothetical protein RLZZ383_1047 [Pseudomonadota bacterium]